MKEKYLALRAQFGVMIVLALGTVVQFGAPSDWGPTVFFSTCAGVLLVVLLSLTPIRTRTSLRAWWEAWKKSPAAAPVFFLGFLYLLYNYAEVFPRGGLDKGMVLLVLVCVFSILGFVQRRRKSAQPSARHMTFAALGVILLLLMALLLIIYR